MMKQQCFFSLMDKAESSPFLGNRSNITKNWDDMSTLVARPLTN